MIIFHPEAEAELLESVSFYEIKASGLGKRFIIDQEDSLSTILENPKLWPTAQANLRKAPLSECPFNLIYRIKNQQIEIIAVAHQRRRPWYWASRQ